MKKNTSLVFGVLISFFMIVCVFIALYTNNLESNYFTDINSSNEKYNSFDINITLFDSTTLEKTDVFGTETTENSDFISVDTTAFQSDIPYEKTDETTEETTTIINETKYEETTANTDTDLIDINKAGLNELMTLKGIGEKIGQRIIDYRESNNGFSSIEEIMNVSGIGEKVFANISPYICVEGEPVKNTSSETDNHNVKININTATKEMLMTLKGIGEVKAQSIIDYRKTNGDFVSISEIKEISGIGDKTFESLKDFITV